MGCFRRWLYTVCRISSITLKPTLAFRRDWAKFRIPEIPAAATMPPINHNRRSVSRCGNASSITRCIKRGVATPSAEVTRTKSATITKVSL